MRRLGLGLTAGARGYHLFDVTTSSVWTFWFFEEFLCFPLNSWINYHCPDQFSGNYNEEFIHSYWLKKPLSVALTTSITECSPSSEVIQADTWFSEQPLFTQAFICAAQWLYAGLCICINSQGSQKELKKCWHGQLKAWKELNVGCWLTGLLK